MIIPLTTASTHCIRMGLKKKKGMRGNEEKEKEVLHRGFEHDTSKDRKLK